MNGIENVVNTGQNIGAVDIKNIINVKNVNMQGLITRGMDINDTGIRNVINVKN